MERKKKFFLFFIVILSIIPLVRYFYMISNVPLGYSLMAPSRAYLLNMNVITSSKMDFVNPWNVEYDESIFSTSGVGSTWILVVLGAFIWNWTSFFAVIGIFMFLTGLSIYIFSKSFSNDNTAIYSTIIYMLSAGLGGIFVLMSGILDPSVFDKAVQAGFGFSGFKNDEAIYYALSPLLGISSLYFLSKKNLFRSSIMLGLCLFVYPNYGFIFFVASAIYVVIFNLKKSEVIKHLPIVAVIASPWIFTIFTGYNYIKTYKTSISTGIGEFLPTMLFAMAFLVFFSIYYMKGKIYFNGWKIFAILLFLTFMISTVGQVGIHGDSELTRIKNIINFHPEMNVSESTIMQVFFIAAMIITMVCIFMKNKQFFSSNMDGFLFIWAALGIIISLFPQNISPWITGRTLGVSTIPLSILAAKGAVKFSSRIGIKPITVIFVIILLSMPTILLYNYYMINPRTNGDLYIESVSLKSLEPLATMENGVVFIDVFRSDLIPYLYGKKSVLSGNGYVINNYWEKVNNYKNLENMSVKEIDVLMKKYKVKYLVIGNNITTIV